MEYLSRKDLEGIASRIISDYKALPRFEGQKVQKIDPIILARELCGYTMDHAHLSIDRLILGVTSRDEVVIPVYDDNDETTLYYMDGSTFLIETDLKNDPTKAGRYNFTVLHEVSHQIISRLFPDRCGTTIKREMYYRGKLQRPFVQDWLEWQADNLASALLLPPDIVWAALHSFGLGDGIDILNRVFRPEQFEKFSAMADFLGASKQALAIRLKELGWLKKEYLQHPYEMLDVWKEEDEP